MPQIKPPILIVDDDALSRHVLGQALDEAGMAYEAVANGTEALEWLASNTPCLIVLDLLMPEPDGYEVLQTIRGKATIRELPVVVLTAIDTDDEVARAFNAGADDFVRKPFRPVEIVARIRGLLRLRGYIDALAQKERDAQILLELTQTLASSLELRDILFTVVQRIAEVVHVDRCSIVLVREAGDVGYVAATSDDQQLYDLEIELDKYPEIRQVIQSREPLVIENAATHPLLDVVRHDLPPNAVASLAILPIVYEDRPMGVLFLRARHKLQVTEHQLAIARTVANATAIALRNARVVQKLRDKTERVTFARFKAERRLQVLKRYATFFESAADGILVADVDGQLLFSNARARELTGFTEPVLRKMKLLDLVIDEDRARMADATFRVTNGLQAETMDVRLRQESGTRLIISVNFSSVLREDNAILLSFRDVTRERAIDTELKKTKEFLVRVIDSSVNAIMSIDEDGIVSLFNRAAERCFGYSSRDVVGKINARELFDPIDDPDTSNILFAPENGQRYRIEDQRVHVLNAQGERVPVALSAALIFENGTSVGSVVVFADLRERLRMEARLAAAQEELEAREKQAIVAELAGAAAHELNQPLTSVMGYAELLRRKLDQESSAFSAAEIILREAERMAEIVRKIGKITRYETKSYVGAAKILDLDRASDDTIPRSRR